MASGADIAMSSADFRSFSLMIFLGLLAYDWLRILIWFDHMGLRVASLVNLSFLGGDRADEAAGRFLGHGARTRAIPDGIRRFGTWAPLLLPFYIPRGADWDKAWTGAEALSHGGGAMPGPVKTLAVAYAVAGAGIVAASALIVSRLREKRAAAGPWLAGAPVALRSNRSGCRSTTAPSASKSGATGAARRWCWATNAAAVRSISSAGRSIRSSRVARFSI